MHASPVRRSVLVNKRPRAVRQHSLEIVVGIAAFVTRRPVADFEVHDLFAGFVDQAVGVARARLEPCALAGCELLPPFVGVQRGPALQDVDELVLPRVGVAKRRYRVGRQAREVDALVGQPEDLPQLALLPARHARREGLGVDRWLAARRHVGSGDGDGVQWVRHEGPRDGLKRQR